MRTPILIQANGTVLNAGQNILINYSPIDGSAASSLFQNQVTLEFYDEVIQLPNGLYEPVATSKVLTGLTGTIQFKAYSSANSPYPVDISPNDTIDISTSNILQWYGITNMLDIVATAVSGAAYVLILVDRG